ncbi:hypothetical protein BaRGS_00014129 [Batillaria attramentaria]|uniref:Secreted protein n=1 Tax=Batillaria attramentaria TaxID=370345 RepID=A0ABD0L5Y0_9CAEN
MKDDANDLGLAFFFLFSSCAQFIYGSTALVAMCKPRWTEGENVTRQKRREPSHPESGERWQDIGLRWTIAPVRGRHVRSQLTRAGSCPP